MSTDEIAIETQVAILEAAKNKRVAEHNAMLAKGEAQGKLDRAKLAGEIVKLKEKDAIKKFPNLLDSVLNQMIVGFSNNAANYLKNPSLKLIERMETKLRVIKLIKEVKN